MANIILTPTSIKKTFDDSLETNASVLSSEVIDGIRYENVNFYGRNTDNGRVKIFGVYAYSESAQVKETVLIFPDSAETVDRSLLKMFVKRGLSALMIDYRGEWEACENYTEYPTSIDYANLVRCGRYKDFVDESADVTSWYEWVSVGLYARKYIFERSGIEPALVGLRDGGEIAWKLASLRKCACLVPVCSAGWLAYLGVSKYRPDEKKLESDERKKFIAGIDSHAYAPYVQCPVLLLCSTNDMRFDYDRAYDTFSRINPEYASLSAIAYSIPVQSTIDIKSIDDMFLFIDKFLKQREIFIPQPAEISVGVDAEQNLIANVKCDSMGIIEEIGLFKAEDCLDTATREWTKCLKASKVSDCEQKVLLDIYSGTSTLFLLAYAKYSNGFTIWSKMAIKKISGRFKNSCDKCKVIYTAKNGTDGFFVADLSSKSICNLFLTTDDVEPQIIVKKKGLKGIYSPYGLTSYRLNSPMYSPEKDNVLKLDVFCDVTDDFNLIITDVDEGEIYRYSQSIVGGVWQSIILESKLFKTSGGVSMTNFAHNMRLCVTCECGFAINNLMWL